MQGAPSGEGEEGGEQQRKQPSRGDLVRVRVRVGVGVQPYLYPQPSPRPALALALTETLFITQPTSAAAIVSGSIISATSYEMSGLRPPRRPLGSRLRRLSAKFASAPPSVAVLERCVASCGVKASTRMKSGASSPSQP